MMNQGGWGLKDVMLYIVVLSFALLIAMLLYDKSFGQLFGKLDSDLDYSLMEKKMVKAAHNYTDNFYYKLLEDGDSDYVSLRILKSDGLLKASDGFSGCSGYVHFYVKNGRTSYVPFLKCGDDYTTDGYDTKKEQSKIS